MILSLLDKDIELAFKDHIAIFKNKFFACSKNIINKQILLCSPDLCTSDSSGNMFRYLCRIKDVECLFIIIDPITNTIHLAYDIDVIKHKSNIAFHGNRYSTIKAEFNMYDSVIENFSIKNIEDEFILVQDISFKHANLSFSNEVRDIMCCLRKYKSEYEIICIMKATKLALLGHRAVAQAFYEANTLKCANELQLYYVFMQSARVIAKDFAYDPIIALNNAGSILHYQSIYDFNQPTYSLLVDCGIKYMGYASDITKSYSDNILWKSLIDQMAFIQKLIVDSLQLGHNFYDAHVYSRRLIAEFLVKNNFVVNINNIDNFTQFILNNEIDRVFYPHGLGHLLGLDVHDVGKDMEIKDGIIIHGQSQTYIRSNFRLENNLVFTIEPGFYLILDLVESISFELKQYLNLPLINANLKFGGIRIETDILIYNNQIYDITKLLESK